MSKKLRATVEWLASHTVAATHESFDPSNYLQSTAFTGTYEKLAISSAFRVPSIKLLPKPRFHQIATRDLPGVDGRQARVPYNSVSLTQDLCGEIVSVCSFLFRGRILVTRVRAVVDVEIEDDLESAVSLLGTLRSAKEVQPVKGLIQAAANTVQGRPRQYDTKTSYNQYFGLQVRMPYGARELDEIVEDLRKPLVALLIGTHNPSMLRDEVVDKVAESSQELNVKAAGELLLLNRQGLLYLLPEGSYQGPHRERFNRTRDLAILANYARTFLRDGHSFHKEDNAAAEDIVRCVAQWVEKPSTTFAASVTQTLSWRALARELDLKELLDAWNSYFTT